MRLRSNRAVSAAFALFHEQVCVYGKAEGAGTGVTLSNTHFAGLGVPIPFDENTGACSTVAVRGLAPNESYVSSSTDCDTSKACRALHWIASIRSCGRLTRFNGNAWTQCQGKKKRTPKATRGVPKPDPTARKTME